MEVPTSVHRNKAELSKAHAKTLDILYFDHRRSSEACNYGPLLEREINIENIHCRNCFMTWEIEFSGVFSAPEFEQFGAPTVTTTVPFTWAVVL